MNHRCETCGEMKVDVITADATNVGAEGEPKLGGYLIRDGCAKCEKLELVDVPRQLWRVKA